MVGNSKLLVIGKPRRKRKRKRSKKRKTFSIIGSVKPIGKTVKKFKLRHLQKKKKTIYG